MLKRIYCFLVLLCFAFGFSQNNQKWQGYFSFNKITDISESSLHIFASSENAFFSKNLSTNDIKTTTSIDGLKAETITAFYHSESVNKTFVGNSNGLLLVVNQDGSILYKSGIRDEVPVPAGIKQINHFLEYNNKLYISTNYGVSVFDLATYEFGDTYYMGPQGSYISVQQTCVNNGFIYAATQGNSVGSGIRKVSITNPFLNDYNQWIDISGSYWNGITAFNNFVYAASSDNKLIKYNGTSLAQVAQYSQKIVDIRTYNSYLIVATQNEVFVYDTNMIQVFHVQNTQISSNTIITCATVIDSIVYVGTKEDGLFSFTISNPNSFETLLPSGPVNNKIFRLKKSISALWVLYGSYSIYYNPYNPGLGTYPISKYNIQNGWSILPYSSLFGAKSLSNIAFNPTNDNIFYVSSYYSGLLKIVNEVPTNLFNQANTGSNGLEPLVDPSCPTCGPDVRINGPAFDKNGDLWMTNNYLTKPLKVLRSNGQWQSYDFTSAESVNDLKDTSYGIPVVDKNGTKWLSKDRNGIIAFNEKYNNKFITIKTGTSGNLPNGNVRCLAIDNKNQLWIGTTTGLRIIPSVDSFISETDIQSKPIIILENDLAQELFYDQFIVDIAVDGANRKWVSIGESGVYLVSPNGQETIYHFTKENSPLPSNTINDIEIDGVTGEVFFATDKGLVSFKGSATIASGDLNSVYAFPNPVRPEYTGTVKIANLTNKATVKITDIEGNLVYETTSEGGTIEWDTTAFGEYKVASGVYMILVSAQDGIETTIKKVMIIR
jgi:ligand-binding sensor domain-containing protein